MQRVKDGASYKQLETIGHQMPGVTVNKLDTGEQ